MPLAATSLVGPARPSVSLTSPWASENEGQDSRIPGSKKGLPDSEGLPSLNPRMTDRLGC